LRDSLGIAADGDANLIEHDAREAQEGRAGHVEIRRHHEGLDDTAEQQRFNEGVCRIAGEPECHRSHRRPKEDAEWVVTAREVVAK